MLDRNEKRLTKINTLLQEYGRTLDKEPLTFTGKPYSVDDFEDWDDLDNVMFASSLDKSIRALLALGIAGYRNRKDWSEGYMYVEDALSEWNDVLTDEYPIIVSEYEAILNSDDVADGRYFRDTEHSYTELFHTANTMIDLDKDLTEQQRKILLKLIKPTNLEFISDTLSDSDWF